MAEPNWTIREIAIARRRAKLRWSKRHGSEMDNETWTRLLGAAQSGGTLVATDLQNARDDLTAADAALAGLGQEQPDLHKFAGNVMDGLTPRQREVMRLLGEGKSAKEIGRIMCISVRTAEMHRKAIMLRTGMATPQALVRLVAYLELGGFFQRASDSTGTTSA